MYKCLACKKEFTAEKQDDDHPNDETYLSCPHCGSQDYFSKVDPPAIVVALMLTGKSFLVSVSLNGRVRRAYATIDAPKAYNKLRDWEWKFIHSPLN